MLEQEYPVKLRKKERSSLEHLTKRGTVNVRVYRRARALLLADEGKKDGGIGEQVGITGQTVLSLRRRFQEERIGCVYDKPRSGRPTKFDGEVRAKITAIACSEAPEGYAKWSYRLLADKAVELGVVEAINYGSVGHILKKISSSPNGSEAGASGS
jgi:putative transposase